MFDDHVFLDRDGIYVNGQKITLDPTLPPSMPIVAINPEAFRLGDDVSYRPITDLWILARTKVKYYGAYPAGFLSRARALLGVRPDDPVLHVCSGMVKDYPFAGFGPNDQTLDGNPALDPTFCLDVTDDTILIPRGFAGILTDPPYTEEDAKHYEGDLPFPSSSALMRKCLEAVEVGSRVGMLHYEWPACPDWAREVAVVGVTTGRRQRMRHYVVMERTK